MIFKNDFDFLKLFKIENYENGNKTKKLLRRLMANVLLMVKKY